MNFSTVRNHCIAWIISLSFLAGCTLPAALTTQTLTVTPEPSQTITATHPSTATSEPASTPFINSPTPTLIPIQKVGQLTIVTYQMKEPPYIEPLMFSSVQGRKFGSEDFSLGDVRFPDRSFFDDTQHYCMQNNLDGSHLVACQGFSTDGKVGWVKLTQNGKEIYYTDTGDPSSINTLEGLWVYDHHWVLETVHVSIHNSGTETEIEDAGQITVDGTRLNTQKNYDEAFSFQTIAGKPFFLFKREGKLGFSYDSEETLLDLYDSVPHYGCCSAAALNPQAWEDHINFFGQQDENWYFVTIGILKP
jgi:hypothetical protein